MFLQSSRSGGRTYWRVVQGSIGEGGWPRLRTIHKLGPHETREEAQEAWDAILRGEKPTRKPAARPGASGRKVQPEGAPKRKIQPEGAPRRKVQPEGAPKRKIPTRAKRPGPGGAARRPAKAANVPPPADEILSPFGELGLDDRATAEQVRAAYRRLAAANHPDRGGITDAMAAINRAYEQAMEALGVGNGPA